MGRRERIATPCFGVLASYAGSDEIIRTVSGFIGEPGVPGQSNRAWTRNTQAAGEEQ